MNYNDILIVAAHPSEASALDECLAKAGMTVEIIITGVGGMNMSWALQRRLHNGPAPLLAINAGIAGSFIPSLRHGAFVIVKSDCFADMGIDDNGKFIPLSAAGLINGDEFPFTNGRMVCSNRWNDAIAANVHNVAAATVNMTSGSATSISRIVTSWNPAIETMEGAWFSYTCMMAGIPWLNLRAVSNMVEPRNVRNWNINAALMSLKKHIPSVIKTVTGL